MFTCDISLPVRRARGALKRVACGKEPIRRTWGSLVESALMPVDALCTACDKNYRVSRKLAGKTVTCPTCGGPIKVAPAPSAPVPAALAKHPAVRRIAPPPRPAPEPEPDPIAGDYDLAALAAAEESAAPLEDRVYVPPTVMEAPPPPRETSRFVRVKNNTPREAAGDLSFTRLFLYSPLFYMHVLVVLGAMLAFAGSAVLTVVVFAYAAVLLSITFFAGYFRALLITGKRWPIFGITGIPLPIYLAVTTTMKTQGMVDDLQVLQQYQVPGIVTVLTLITLAAFTIHAILDFKTMARAAITGCYFILDLFIIIGLAVQAAAFLHRIRG